MSELGFRHKRSLFILSLLLWVLVSSCASFQKGRRPEDNFVNGFRVQLIQTSDREEADEIQDLAILRFREEVYRVFEAPYYKVRIGDFTDWHDAEELQKRAKQKGFQDAWVVGDRVMLNKTIVKQTRKPGPVLTDSRYLKGGKFGFFDIEEPAIGVALGIRRISPHLHLNLDGDLVLSDATTLLLDSSLRYLFDPTPSLLPYIGGGPGLAIGDDKTFTAHLAGGFDFRIDSLPAFTELKIHLSDPEAITLWFGLRF